MTESILYTVEGHIGRLTLNIPERHNALGTDELEAIRRHLEVVAGDEQVRVLIVTGAGHKSFCAGASLQQLDAGELRDDRFQATTALLADLEIPTIAALNGNVFGGGVELALSCDFRIGIEGSRMRVPAAAIGICYPASGINLFVRRLGANVARRVLVASEEFDASAMLQIGFLDRLVLPSQLGATASALAERVATLAPLAVRSMKRLLQQAEAGGIDPELAAQLAAACMRSDDFREGLSAQREKRQPRFRGR